MRRGRPQIEVEDVALALLRFGDGGLGVLEATTNAYPGYQCLLRMSGTKGTVVLEDGALVSAEFDDNGAPVSGRLRGAQDARRSPGPAGGHHLGHHLPGGRRR